MAILQKKIELDQLEKYNIPKDVLKYIAENVKTNIRELEGSLNKLIALYKLNHEGEIDIPLAAEARRRVLNENYEVSVAYGEGVRILSGDKANRIIRCFEQDNNIASFAFAILNDLFTSIIKSNESYPNGRHTNSRRPLIQATVTHLDPSVAFGRFPRIRIQNMIPPSPIEIEDPLDQLFEMTDIQEDNKEEEEESNQFPIFDDQGGGGFDYGSDVFDDEENFEREDLLMFF